MGLQANDINTIKDPFHMQWACQQMKLPLLNSHFTCNGPTGKQNYHYKAPISHAMGLPANKIILWNTHFTCNAPAGKQNYHYKIPILHAMGLPPNKILTENSFRTPISHAMDLPANRIITIKHPFYMQWACWQTELSL